MICRWAASIVVVFSCPGNISQKENLGILSWCLINKPSLHYKMRCNLGKNKHAFGLTIVPNCSLTTKSNCVLPYQVLLHTSNIFHKYFAFKRPVCTKQARLSWHEARGLDWRAVSSYDFVATAFNLILDVDLWRCSRSSCTVLHSFQLQKCSNKGRLVVLITFVQGGEALFFTCASYEPFLFFIRWTWENLLRDYVVRTWSIVTFI